jgi:hypothetical protein
LPGDWHSGSFLLPRRLGENIGKLGGEPARVVMHNDAVVQGLSEMPFLHDVRRWAVLTIGTGLGNASYSHRPPDRADKAFRRGANRNTRPL